MTRNSQEMRRQEVFWIWLRGDRLRIVVKGEAHFNVLLDYLKILKRMELKAEQDLLSQAESEPHCA